MFGLGHGFSSVKVLPAPDKRAQQRNKGLSSFVKNVHMLQHDTFNWHITVAHMALFPFLAAHMGNRSSNLHTVASDCKGDKGKRAKTVCLE